ncbi:hypothetical protein M3M33_01475 [Loigolactobacillus coryniformis]|uniref:hypothetical protein n=1 Tax=Loigolactobacillus coryniformis TaxID=1610 RepID=UPI00201A7A97|nr:hypothetical protein [Loigolactobacillus coryniformis]MCL5457334.1 hypothetical protein [Loigolactobacillus coryniformis]
MEGHARKTRFSITRSQATRRPVVIRPTPKFYQLTGGNQIIATLEEPSKLKNDSLFHEIPVILNQDDQRTPNYKIIGGFNNNCVQVELSEQLLASIEHHVEWVCLLTFTGFQFKYVSNNSKQKLLFALADEDAYCYCDKNPCEECRFKCKNGFAVYTYWQGEGIFGRDISSFGN